MRVPNDATFLRRSAVIAGVLAWLLGVIVAVVVLVLFSSIGSNPVDILAGATVFYYTFHLWPVVLVPGGLSTNALLFAPFAMLLVFWAGFRVALRGEATTGRDGFRMGAGVTVGYLASAVLSLPAFTLTLETSPFADPVVLVTILGITGVAFPVVFGGLGGWLAGR